MDDATRIEIENCFLKVSRNAARNKLYALRAEKDGDSQLARLFYAVAISEEAQTLRFLFQLRGQIGNTSQNCEIAFEKEIPALRDQYKHAINTAEKGNERAMTFAFSQSEKVARIYSSLKKKLEKDPMKNTNYHICSFCGFISEDHAPERCPICSAASSRFTKS